jgi:sugar/nucleoside kinase (ribokinase family)
VGVIGDDFREEDVERLRSRGIDLAGLERRPGGSFRWLGRYDYAMNTAQTINTDLGVFAEWQPQVPESFADSEFVFLANIDPEIQLATLRSVRAPKAIALDTMNYWIDHKRDALLEVMSHVDIVSINESEARQLCDTVSVPKAARDILALGPRAVVVKRGEYGSVLFTRAFSFWSPAFPFDEVTDPTGAGDSFAGGFLGHLAECGSVDDRALRRATLHGTVCASFAVESFSVDGIEAATPDDVAARYRLLQDLVKV